MIDEKNIQEALDWADKFISSPPLTHPAILAAAYRDAIAEREHYISLHKINIQTIDDLSGELDNARMDYANCTLTLDEVMEERDLWQKSEKECNEAYKKLSKEHEKLKDIAQRMNRSLCAYKEMINYLKAAIK